MKKKKKKVVLGPVVPMTSGQFVKSSVVGGSDPAKKLSKSQTKRLMSQMRETIPAPETMQTSWTEELTVDVGREYVSNNQFTPEEKRVWLAAATNMSIMLSNEDLKTVAQKKAAYADEMLRLYRAKFLVARYAVDIKFQDRAAMIEKALGSPEGITWVKTPRP